MWVGVPILSGCGFCCWRGVAIWAWGIWGFPGGGFLGGFGAGAAALAWMGYWWLLDAVSLAAACGAAGDACAGGRRLPAWRPHCSGVGRGGVWDLWALCLRVGVTAGPGGLGSWLVCRREHGLVHALGPGSGVGSSMHRCLRRGGGSNRGGVNGLYLGVLLSYVVWELTGWWGGVVFPLLWGLVGRPGLPMGPGLDGPGPPALGRFGVTGVPMGVSGGAGSRGGGILPPLMLSSPSLRLHFSRSITPTHR